MPAKTIQVSDNLDAERVSMLTYTCTNFNVHRAYGRGYASNQSILLSLTLNLRSGYDG